MYFDSVDLVHDIYYKIYKNITTLVITYHNFEVDFYAFVIYFILKF